MFRCGDDLCSISDDYVNILPCTLYVIFLLPNTHLRKHPVTRVLNKIRLPLQENAAVRPTSELRDAEGELLGKTALLKENHGGSSYVTKESSHYIILHTWPHMTQHK